MLCEDKFREIYRTDPESISFCPYRICPIGAHSDHNLGKVSGFAIDKGIHIAYKPKHNGVVELCSLQFDKRAQWHCRGVAETRQGDWADYLRGVTIELGERYPLSMGVSGIVEGSLPIGGLSSSAAVSIAFLKALCDVNSISISDAEMIEITVASENNYVGVNCGKLDQSCEVYSRKDHLLYLDCRDNTFEHIPVRADMKPFKPMVFFSGLERSLAGSAFNMRVDELRAAAYALLSYAGLPYGKFPLTNMRDVPFEVYERYKSRLPENWRRRAEHWVTEFNRVEQGVDAFRRGDIDTYGRLCSESGASSINSWETGSEELISLYEIIRNTDGVYGGRFSGAGFRGSCIALVDPSFAEDIREKVKAAYIAKFPALESNYMSVLCDTADGVSGL